LWLNCAYAKINHMGTIDKKYLTRIREILKTGNESLDMTKNLLCNIALGEQTSKHYQNRKTAWAWNNLRRYKFVRHIKNEAKDFYLLTPKGEARLKTIVIDEIEIKSRKHWDGKWRLVMYDLPIRFKRARNAFRWKLKDLGFFQFQKSAWIFPYPCEEELSFVADFFGVQKYVEILEVNKISNEAKLKSHFGL